MDSGIIVGRLWIFPGVTGQRYKVAYIPWSSESYTSHSNPPENLKQHSSKILVNVVYFSWSPSLHFEENSTSMVRLKQ